MKYFVLIVQLYSSQLHASGSCDTSVQTKVLERLIGYISTKCSLADSTSEKLEDCFQSYIKKLKKCRQNRVHCDYLEVELQNEIIAHFGERVYKEYLNSIYDHRIPGRKIHNQRPDRKLMD